MNSPMRIGNTAIATFCVTLATLVLSPMPAHSKDIKYTLKADLLEIKKPNELLFKFEKTATKTGDVESIVRKFTDPSGTLAAEERVTIQNNKLQKLELDHKQLGQSGSLEVREGKLFFTYTSDKKTKKAEEKIEGDLVSPEQIHNYLNSNWARLMAGETLSIRFPVLDRLETVGFKFFKEKEADLDGIKATVIKMKPSSFVIAALVDPILFYYHPTEMLADGHKIIQVVGRTVPKRKVGEKFKDLDTIMKFIY